MVQPVFRAYTQAVDAPRRDPAEAGATSTVKSTGTYDAGAICVIRMTTTHPILVIEDHEDTRHMVQTALEVNGFATVGAADGLRGLHALQQYRPCIILLDLSMPVMDGWRFRTEQQQLADQELAGVPVVVVSAVSDCQEHGRKFGAADVIPKPVDIDRILRVVQQHCGE
jgi:CheY-like chemotaxis protein